MAYSCNQCFLDSNDHNFSIVDYYIFHLKALSELCDMSISDFCVLQVLPSYISLKISNLLFNQFSSLVA